ncbi:MAG: hypothetical protein H8E44_30770 [Planctomycetes bacterium]|nr:hypothetical protein [Planctomycetota bacterium]MBL7039992.1 hypothetical protein [Pirellulaceae bacterium]
MPESRPKRRWYHITPDRLIMGLLAVEGFLLLSEWFRWFAFNEKKGWTVLIAMAAVCLVVVVMLVWLAASLLFRWRFQFSLRSLAVLIVAVAVPCCWLTVKMRQAERQRRAVEAIDKAGAWIRYDCQFDGSGKFMRRQEPPGPAWLRKLLGKDFFADVIFVLASCTHVTDAELQQLKVLTKLRMLNVNETQVTDDGVKHLKALTDLSSLGFYNTQLTDAGLEHLKGLTKLKRLGLQRTHVTEEGIKELRQALPSCAIYWDEGRNVDLWGLLPPEVSASLFSFVQRKIEQPVTTPKTNLDQN